MYDILYHIDEMKLSDIDADVVWLDLPQYIEIALSREALYVVAYFQVLADWQNHPNRINPIKSSCPFDFASTC